MKLLPEYFFFILINHFPTKHTGKYPNGYFMELIARFFFIN
jgi:hypothetical protein